MDHLQQVLQYFRRYLFLVVFIENVVLVMSYWYLSSHTDLNPLLTLAGFLGVALLFSWLLMYNASDRLIQPLRALWQAILHLSPGDQQLVPPPDLQKLRVGRELVANLTGQIYQLTSVADRVASNVRQEGSDLRHNFIANNLPLPLFVLDATETIRFANESAAKYIGIASADLVGKNVYMVLDMSFPNEDTFDVWLKSAKTKNATATKSWERVRLNVRDNHPTRLFDLAGYYNKDNSQKAETMLVLFDHTKQYSQDEQAVSFIALSVHELRTPLTLLRGYIEVFEEELTGKIDPELADFMQKMSATAQQLTAFVNNILNVARVDNDQLELQLQSEDWSVVLANTIDNLDLRAKVRGITLEHTIAPGLPPVGVDRLSIHEVINNLVDNAIKYSGTSKVIKIDSHLTPDGLVETTVQDNGLGISSSIMPNLFTKFYRDHRNRAQIGGTGLGLYLSNAIVTAHGGHLWVRSKLGEGSTFGFTLLPYSRLADEVKNSDNKEIVRGAHGWIKNHSLYRR